jgi:hypothetical protein
MSTTACLSVILTTVPVTTASSAVRPGQRRRPFGSLLAVEAFERLGKVFGIVLGLVLS